MSSEVAITLTGDAARLVGELQRVVGKFSELEGGAKGVAEAYKADARAARDLERDAKRAWESTRTPQEQHIERIRRAEQFIGKAGFTQKDYARYVKQSEEKMRQLESASTGAGTAGTASFASAINVVQGLAGAAGIGAVVAALGKVHEAYEVWNEDVKRVSENARKQTADMIAFAALQEGGTKAEMVRQAQSLAISYGIGSDQTGEAFQTMQAMQSLPGSNAQKGLELTEEVFAASKLGVPLAAARELETLGASQGMQPNELLRMAFVAGEASSRSPADLARAGAGMEFFGDKQFGMAAAGVLAGSLPQEQLSSYLKAGGRALSKTGSAQEAFEEAGLGQASQEERLRWLKKQGITSPEKLGEFGFTELEGMQAVSSLVKNIPDIDRIRGLIKEKAKPGLIETKTRDLFEELPETLAARELEIAKARSEAASRSGPAAIAAMREERTQYARGQAAREMGIATIPELSMVPIAQSKIVDDSGRASSAGFWSVAAADALKGIRDLTPGGSISAIGRYMAGGEAPSVFGARTPELMRRTGENLSAMESDIKATTALDSSAEKLDRAASKLGFGPDRALSKPDIDR